MHTLEKDPEINQIRTQNQTKQDDWSENLKKTLHISDLSHYNGETSFRVHSFVYSLIVFFILISTLLFSKLSASLWKFISTKPLSQGLVTDHWSSYWDSTLSLPLSDFCLWLGTEILIQTMLAMASQEQKHSHSFKTCLCAGRYRSKRVLLFQRHS